MHSDRPEVAKNKSINATVWHCLDVIGSEAVNRQYLRDFRLNRADNWQVTNLFRQLVVGAFLADMGHTVEPNPSFESLTPDWLARGDQAFVAEVFTHYLDNPTRQRFEQGQVVRLDEEANSLRLHQSLVDKASKYQQLTAAAGFGYVIAVCIELSSALDREQMEQCALATDGVFASHSGLSGMLTYAERNGRHQFGYVGNPNSSIAIRLPRLCSWISVAHARV